MTSTPTNCVKMKTFTKAFAIVLFSLPLLASATGKVSTASMQVSFEVKESCNVQRSAVASAAATKTTPAVACQLKSPYAMTRTQAVAANSTTTQAAAIRQATAAGEWTITF
ncbi:hypothetical protein HH213_24750 [Duganella dendranthematis]|uniref:Uncharacterized protein n=1 Tax=Duganella dendranthematis TaxID=2728021 RepID=A0ABX6MGF3_9BURK|nr:hypothetical protein [Duganella dendranthematis]QJD93019.1 hypothetical protein HH213_24750 [Duganella dendranthematis]